MAGVMLDALPGGARALRCAEGGGEGDTAAEAARTVPQLAPREREFDERTSSLTAYILAVRGEACSVF